MDTPTHTSTEAVAPKAETANVPNPPTTDAKTLEGQHAGFWIRFLALIIDSIIISIISKILHIGGYSYSFNQASLNYGMQGWSFILNVAYFVGFWTWQSATPGKMVLSLKIIGEDGTKLTWQKAVIRYLSMILSAIPFFLGFIWVGFNPKKQGWHDLLAKTYVVKTK